MAALHGVTWGLLPVPKSRMARGVRRAPSVGRVPLFTAALPWHGGARSLSAASEAAPEGSEDGVAASLYLSERAQQERRARTRGEPITPGRLPDFLAPTMVVPGKQAATSASRPERASDQALSAAAAVRHLAASVDAADGSFLEEEGDMIGDRDATEEAESVASYRDRAQVMEHVGLHYAEAASAR